MQDNQITDLDAVANARGRKLGEAKTTTSTDQFDEMSDEEIRDRLRDRGLEVRKARQERGKMARPDKVTGKRRLTVHMPDKLVKTVKAAAQEINCSESKIVEEACKMWVEANNLSTT